MTKNNVISLGLDLSLQSTGIILLENGELKKEKTIKSKPSGDRPVDELKRIRKIAEEIELIVGEYMPQIAIVENLAFMARNSTALTQLSGLSFFVRAILADYNIPFYLVAPSSLKKFITGKGNAMKDQVMMEVYKRWNFSGDNSDLSDAYGLAKMGYFMLNSKEVTNKEQKECLKLLEKQA